MDGFLSLIFIYRVFLILIIVATYSQVKSSTALKVLDFSLVSPSLEDGKKNNGKLLYFFPFPPICCVFLQYSFPCSSGGGKTVGKMRIFFQNGMLSPDHWLSFFQITDSSFCSPKTSAP